MWTRKSDTTITDGAYVIRRCFTFGTGKTVYCLMQIDPNGDEYADYLPVSDHATMGDAKKARTAIKRAQKEAIHA